MNKITNSNISLEALKNGEGQAFEQLYKQTYRMIETFIRNNKGTADDAQDIFQETLIVLVKNLRKEGFELKSKLGTYLYSIARNLWLYRLRGTKGVHNISIEDAGEKYLELDESDVVRKKVDEQRYELMADKLAELKEDCQKIIIDFYKNGKQLVVLAKEMGYTDKFIRVKKNRCINAYRKKVQGA